MSKTRPLSDVQERTLIAIRMVEERDGTKWHPAGWVPVERLFVRSRTVNTIIRLEELGLIESDAGLDREPGSTWGRMRGTGVRTTEAGRALLDSMGD